MQTDDVVWQLLSNGFCSYKTQTKTQKFCRSEWNLTGLCTRQACPMANSQYATVREEKGRIYLYMKEVERSHFPERLWEKVRLPQNLENAMAVIDERLLYWPKFIRFKCKQRLIRYQQVLVRMRKLMLKSKKKIIPISRKIEKRELRRETKALAAARIDKAIERELLERLQQGTYGDLYDFNEETLEKERQLVGEKNATEGKEVGENVQYVEDFEESEVSDMEDFAEKLVSSSSSQSDSSDDEKRVDKRKKRIGKLRKKRVKYLIRKPRVEVEYEEEIPSTSRNVVH
ncbi:Protein MAK16 -like protein [Trichinella murrelli]|uniref:Protein MAK16 homolog n=1 Tax=Trichinella murrelli TaxID=144512 RepID=A0A0V0U028_9BILA|nr:Protein MAK16 -like protein [Trichinella murrelli]